MKKIVMSMIAGVVLLSSTLYAEEAVKPVQNSTDGFYLGLGGGASYDLSFLSENTYYQDNTVSYDTGTLSDSDAGYIVYGGYQINKIIAVEAAYTDYGSFSDTAKVKNTAIYREFSSDPRSLSVYANAGYTFQNGLRPFGQLGLGYMQRNVSASLENIDISDEDVTVRFGLGLDYAPSTLKGFGFRVAMVEDVVADFNYHGVDADGNDKSTVWINVNSLFYIGASYKF